MKAGWEKKPLLEVATLQRGFDLPSTERIAGRFPLVSSSGIIDTHNKHAVIGPGVVTGRSGSIGNVFHIKDNYWPLNTVLYVKDFHGNDPKFVFYLLQYLDLSRFATGTGVPTLNRNIVHDELVRIPPLAKQRSIVDILDDAFDKIAVAKVNAANNLTKSREIFQSELTNIFTRHETGWTEKPLGALASFRNGINYNKLSSGERVKIVGVKDFKDDFWAPLDKLDTISIDGNLDAIDELRDGDVLTVRSNGNAELIGRCILAANVSEKMTHSGFTIRMRTDRSELLPEFLCHYMKSSQSRTLLTAGSTGTNIKSLNQQSLAGLNVRYPCRLTEQREVVSRIERLSADTKRLEDIYRRKIAALDELKKSLLHQAFSGGL